MQSENTGRIVVKSYPAVVYVIGRLGLDAEDILVEEAPDGATLFKLPVEAATAIENYFELRRVLGQKTDAARGTCRFTSRRRYEVRR